MEILISSMALDYSGVPTYTYTLYNELTKMGHDVQIYSPKLGGMAELMFCVDKVGNIDSPEIILAQHKSCADELRYAFPNMPIVFNAHGTLPEGEQKPNAAMQRFVAINEATAKNLLQQGVEKHKLDIVRDFIDVDRFSSENKINRTLKNVLYVSNYRRGKTWEVINKACVKLNLNFSAVGAVYGRAKKIEHAMNWADLVISSGRVLLEAMSCERAVLSFEKERGYGYITPQVYWDSREYNMGWPTASNYYEVDSLIEQINKYSQIDGVVNRELILEHHNSVDGAMKIVSILKKTISEYE